MNDEMKRGQEKRGPRGDKERNQRQNRAFGGKNDDKKPFRSANSGEHGARKTFAAGNGGRNGAAKPAFGRRDGEQGAARGEKPAFSRGISADRGETRPKRSFDRAESGERRAFGSGAKREGGSYDRPRGDKPAFGGEKRTYSTKPAGERSFGKPAGERTFGKPAGERRYGKPAGERTFGKPAGERTFAKPAGERTFAKPVGDRPYGKPVERKYGRPAPVGSGVERVPEHAHTDGLPSRRLALAVLREVTENGAYASLALDSKLENCGLSHEDRRLVSRLVYDTLEHLLYIDHALKQVMAKPDTDIKLLNILRLGACQILLEDRIPESAATNTAVNLCKEIGLDGLAGVCNGILRNLIRQKDELVWPSEAEEPIRALSVKYSMPEWLVERLLADYGYDEAVALMSAHPDNTYITVRPNMTKLDAEAFEQLLQGKVWAHEPGKVPGSWRIRGMVDVSHDTDFVGGNFSIQNESSMMACMALAPKRGWTVLDVCAAPGGKTCLMAEMMNNTGRVQAWDVHEHRVDLIEAQRARLGLENVRPIIRDTMKLREELLESADAVLLDAPCSGTGDMMDKPDVKYRVTPESVAELVDIQRQMLDNVATYVKRGGVLVYSTCSVLKDENERQVAAFLARHPEFTLDTMPDTVPPQFSQYQSIGLQLLPHRDEVGGFYIARMRRKRV